MNGDTAVYHYDAVGNLLSIDRHSSSLVSIISFGPGNGPVGATVTIAGTGFSSTLNQNTVSFNGTAATVSTASATQLVVAVPSGATSGTITVTAPGGSATSATNFVVTAGSLAPIITSFSPTAGPSPTAFTITGTNFDATLGNDRGSLNATLLSFTSGSLTQLSTTVPGSATSGRLRVATRYGIATSATDFWVAPTGYTASNLESKIRLAGFGDSNAVITTLTSSSNVGLVIFDGSAPQRVSIKLSNVTLGLGTATLLSPTGAALTSAGITALGTLIEPVTLAPGAPYTHTLLIKPTNSTGNVGVTVYDVPPDPTGTITIGGAVTTTLNVPGQNSRYTFSATAGQQVSLRGTAETIPSATVSILKPDGSTLASASFTASGGFIDTQTLPTTGTYTIFVDPVGSNTGSVTLTLYDAAEQTGTIPTDGTSTTVTTSIPGQNVRLSFAGTSGHRMSVKVSNGPSGSVSVLDRDGVTVLGSATIGALTTLVEPVTLPADGSYAVYVNYSGAGTGSVTLNLYDVPADQTGTINPGGSAVTLTFTTPGQNAVYTLGTPTNARVSLKLGATSLLAAVTVRQSSGSTATSGNTNVVNVLIEPWTFASGQTIKVDPVGASTGSVTLTAYDVPADFSGTVTVGGSAVNVPITQPGQNGTLTFSGTASQQVTVHVTGNTMGSVTVKLLGTNGQTVLTSSTSSASSFNLSTVTLSTTGTYTIVIDPSSTNTGTLNVSVTSP